VRGFTATPQQSRDFSLAALRGALAALRGAELERHGFFLSVAAAGAAAALSDFRLPSWKMAVEMIEAGSGREEEEEEEELVRLW
jgi:hypothetical protein